MRLSNIAPASTAAALALATGIAITMGGLPISIAVAGASVLTVLATWPRSPAKDTATTRYAAICLILLAYIVPMLLTGRIYALLGLRPLFVPDVLLMFGAALMLPRLRTAGTAPFTLLSFLLLLFVAQSVLVGSERGYSGAVKGLVLGVYPVLAAIIASWLGQQDNLTKLLSVLPRYLLPLSTLGLAVLLVTNQPIIPSAFGLYIGIGAAFAAVPSMPNRKLLAIASAVGFLILVGFAAKRGPALAILLGPCAAWFASRSYRLASSRRLTVVTLLTSIALSIMSLSLIGANPSNLPIVGQLISRVTRDSDNEGAANNVTLRREIWSYALSTTANQNPLFGAGAYHPIEVTSAGDTLADDPETGAHNSFVGYAFFAGFLAALIAIYLFALALYRVWRTRFQSIYAPALFGSMIVVIATAMTNVALETTYIGGPSWLVVAGAMGLSAYIYRTVGPQGRSTSEPL